MIVFLCTGIWHGASWNFIAWGCTHGMLIIIERLFLLKYLEKSSIFSRIYLMTTIITTWLFFTIEDFNKIIIYLKKMYFISGTSGILHLNVFMSRETWTVLGLAIIFSVPWHRIIVIKRPKTVTIVNYLNTLFLLVLFVLCISNLASETYNPFIYFRF